MTIKNLIVDETNVVSEHIEDVAGTVKDKVTNVELTLNQRLLVTGVAAVVASTIIQKAVRVFRARKGETVLIDETVLIESDDVAAVAV